MQRVDVQVLNVSPNERLQVQNSLGETLRHERQRRGVDIHELHEETKIKVELLTALENDRHDILPTPCYTKGFIRAVCRYLELPTDEMLMLYDREGPSQPTKVMTNQLLVPQRNIWVRLFGWLKALFIGKKHA